MTTYHKFWKRENSFGIEGEEVHNLKKLYFTLECSTIQLWVGIKRGEEESEALVYMEAKQAMQMAKALRELALRAFEEETK